MYRISINGVTVQETLYPNWVKWKAKLQCYVVCGESDAEAILIPADEELERESFYANISGKAPADPAFPTAVIEKV